MRWVACGCNSSFLTDLFETLQVFLSWSEDVHLVLGLSFHDFFINFFGLVFFSGQIIIRIDTLCAQLLLEFSTNHFETIHTCSTWSVDVHVVLGLSSRYFYQLFFYLVFQGWITIRIDTLWAQLLLEFSTDHFETMDTCSTSSVDVHMVLELSFFYSLSFFFFLLFQLSFFQV